MKNLSTNIFLIVLLFVVAAAEAQVQTPSQSPAGSVSTVVGLTDIKIDYFRPRARGRKIFGTEPGVLTPYGQIWRTGANGGTTITFSDDVNVEGTAVPKGSYLIFSWPTATEWTIALYKDLTLGGNTGGYDKSKEVANFKVKSERLTEKVETFTINITDIADNNKSAKVQIAWENTSVKFTVNVDFDAKVMAAIDANTKVNPNNYFQSAVYYLENGKDLNKALTWINEALKDPQYKDAFWVLYQKARIQKALGDKKGAMETSTASLAAAKAAKNPNYQAMNEELLKSLK